MALELFGMTGTKLYIALIVALAVIIGGGYAIMEAGADPFEISGDDEDTFSINYVDEGESSVAFTSSPTGATIKISGETYTTPTGDINLDPASYDYVVDLEGHVGQSATVVIEDGKAKTLNVVLEVVPEPTETPTPDETPDATPTPTPDETPDETPDGTPTPEPTPEYDIPYCAVDVRIVAGTAFQGVDVAGAYDAAHWNEVAGKYLYLTSKNEIKLTQVSKWPNGVGNNLIEYNTEVPTGYNEFEHEQTYGGDIDFRLEYTGSSTTGTVGDVLLGSFNAPSSANAVVMKINVVPKSYGFMFDVNKRDGEGPEITDEKVEPVAISGSAWTLASLAAWDPFTTSAIDVYTGPAQGNFDTKYPVHSWAFWGTVLDGNQNWIGGETPARVVVRASDADNYDTTGKKVLYIRLIDNEQILPGSGAIAHYKIDYTVTNGYVEVDDVTKI
ncbi:MAG: hypothetical protein KAJ19_21065 [Gammaproteobacteria bacterium]|nr:hypothetical protein [Gammaproteobacteria bacterium]